MQHITSKILLFILPIVILVIVGIIIYWQLLPDKSQNQSQQPVVLDLSSYSKFDKSSFGFMHPQQSYGFVKELGVHWQRPHPGPFIWENIESQKGKYDWSQTDEYVKISQNYDVLIAVTIWPYADWDQETCHNKLPNSPRGDFSELGDYRGKPCDNNAYQKFVKALVERYDGNGQNDMPNLKYPIKYWEVINEPEMQGELLFFKGDNQAKDYLEVLKSTYLAIKETDHEAKVLNGGIAALSSEEIPFWQEVLGGEGKNYVDIITIHSIGGSDDLNLNVLKKFMAQNNITQSIWLTEIQFGGPDDINDNPMDKKDDSLSFNVFTKVFAQKESSPLPPPPKKNNYTQEEWSQYLVKTFVDALANGANRLFYVGLDNLAPASENSLLVNCQQNKLKKEIDSSTCNKQKPFDAFQTMVRKLDYFSNLEKIASGQYRFDFPDKTVYVLWGDKILPAEISRKTESSKPSQRTKITDIYGQEQNLSDVNQLKLTDNLVYLEI